MSNPGGLEGLSPEARQSLLQMQIAECWADNRNFDVLVWAIPAATSAIAGLILNAIVSVGDGSQGWFLRGAISAGGALLSFPLILALIKNRKFQVQRNDWRAACYFALVAGGSPRDFVTGIRPAPETASDLTPFSTLRVNADPIGKSAPSSPPPYRRGGPRRLGASLWRFSDHRFGDLSAFDLLLAVSWLTLAAELVGAVAFSAAGAVEVML